MYQDAFIAVPKLSRKQAAAYLGIAEQTLANDAVTGSLSVPFYKVGSRAIYSKSELDEWLSERKQHRVAA